MENIALFGYSNADHWFFSQGVTPNGQLLPNLISSGTWQNPYQTMTTYNVSGENFIFGLNRPFWGTSYFFVQRLLPTGVPGPEVQNGHWQLFYDIVFPLYFTDAVYLFGLSFTEQYWFIQQINDDGTLGAETSSGQWSARAACPCYSGGQCCIFSQNDDDSLRWFVTEVNPDGTMAQRSTQGTFENFYPRVGSFNLGDQCYLFGHRPGYQLPLRSSFFIQMVTADGDLGATTCSQQWQNFYETIGSLTQPDGSVYMYGQTTNQNRFFLQPVNADGCLDAETYSRNWNYYFENILPFPYFSLDKSDWMSTLLATVTQPVTLRDMVIPGSHDAAMYLAGPLSKPGRTQDQTLYDQLRGGVRYFDLRPCWSTVYQTYLICHGPTLGPAVADVVSDIARFMAEGHRELVILKFSHFQGIDDAAGYEALLTIIRQALQTWMLTKPLAKRPAEVDVKSLLGKVLVVVDNGLAVANPAPDIFLYRDWQSDTAAQGDFTVFDQYSNTTDFDFMKTDQLNKFEKFDGVCQDKRTPCDLFLLSWTLTPVTSVWSYAQVANAKLGESVGSIGRNPYGKIPNILYVDYYEYASVTEIAIHLTQQFLP